MPMSGAFGSARHACSVHVVSQAGVQSDALSGLTRPLAAVWGCRTIDQRNLVLNDALPRISVDADTYEIGGGGQLPTSEPADLRSLAPRYFLP